MLLVDKHFDPDKNQASFPMKRITSRRFQLDLQKLIALKKQAVKRQFHISSAGSVSGLFCAGGMFQREVSPDVITELKRKKLKDAKFHSVDIDESLVGIGLLEEVGTLPSTDILPLPTRILNSV